MAGLTARCPHCGALGLEGAVFCVECGGRMPSADPNFGQSVDPRATQVIAPAKPSEPSSPAVSGNTRPNLPGLPPPLSRRPPPPKRSTLPGAGGRGPFSRPPSTPAGSPGSISEALADAASGGAGTPRETPSTPAATPTPEVSAGATPVQEKSNPTANPEGASGSGMRRMLDDIDRKFDTILTDPPPHTTDLTWQELVEAQRLFLEIATNYLNPVRDLMVEIDLGEPTKDWLSVCRPAVTSLRRAAQEMLLTDLATGLSELLGALEQSEKAPGNTLDQRSRDALKSAYEKLVQAMPEAFAVKQERDRREPIIVQSLLRQVPEVRKVAIDRIYAAGITNLEMFYKARPSDIAEAAGIARELAERIVARFQRYKRELGSSTPAPRRSREKTQLENLTKRLEEQNGAFDASTRSWTNIEDKRRIRAERASTLLEINLLLARLGEVALVQEIERLPFEKKAEALRRHLAAQTN